MTMEMTAAEYGKLAVGIRHHDIGIAQMYATLALAAATLEAAEANYEAHKRRLLEALNEEAEDPSEEDLIRFEEALKDGTDNCPGCGCVPNVLGPDGVWVCEEYPGCSALMESEPETCAYEWKSDGQHKWPTDVHPKHRCDNIKGHQIRAHICECGATGR